jgi:prepilin-type N-terminal cleavage/methylation domain-containing protein
MNRRPASSQDGFTFVEVLIALVVFAIVSTAFYQVLFTQAKAGDTTRSVARISDTARLGFNRMVRDVREADSISNVTSTQNAFTVKVNYNNDGFYQNPNAQGDNEIITYTFDPVGGTISLCASSSAGACSGAAEVLMTGVSAIPGGQVFSYFGNNLDWDWGSGSTPCTTGTPDGVVTWQEIDCASNSSHGIVGVGNLNVTLDSGELPYLTSIAFGIRVTDGRYIRDFSDTAQLRNRV